MNESQQYSDKYRSGNREVNLPYLQKMIKGMELEIDDSEQLEEFKDMMNDKINEIREIKQRNRMKRELTKLVREIGR